VRRALCDALLSAFAGPQFCGILGPIRRRCFPSFSVAPVEPLCRRLAHAALYRRAPCRLLARGVSGFGAEHLIVQAVIAQLALAVDVAEVGLPLCARLQRTYMDLFLHAFLFIQLNRYK
jgi:hypothetical protein